MPLLFLYPIAIITGIVGGGVALNYSLKEVGEGVGEGAKNALPAIAIGLGALYLYSKLK